MLSNQSLFSSILNYQIGAADASLSFAKRLARENGWSQTRAEQAIVEYKKFIYLIVTSDSPQTPSDAVDQVWHLHLTYTQCYWQEFCGELLKINIHHGPTAGGKAENQRYRQQYQHTLDAYRKNFGEPPTNIWPNVEQRFAEAPHFVRVNRQNTWLLDKPTLSTFKWPLFAGVSSLLAACSTVSGEVNLAWLWLVPFIGIVIFIAARSRQSASTSTNKSRDSGASVGAYGAAEDAEASSSDAAGDSSGGDSGCGSGCGGCGG